MYKCSKYVVCIELVALLIVDYCFKIRIQNKHTNKRNKTKRNETKTLK